MITHIPVFAIGHPDGHNGVRENTIVMALRDEYGKRNRNLRMWVLLVIFLFLAGLFVYDHFHQSNRHMENSVTNDDQADY